MPRLSSLFLIGAAALFALPFITIVVAAFGTDWSTGVLPGGWDTAAVTGVLSDPRFQAALGRSLAVSGAALLLSAVLMVPAILAGHIYWPALDRWLARLVVLPYAVPGVVLVVGYLRVFSHPALALNGTPWILVLAYVPLCFPMFYVSIKGALTGLPIADWLDAGRLMGMRDERILIRVVLPMIAPQILLGAVLGLGILLGEFVYANMLVGGRFETLQIYMYAQRTESGSVTAAIILFYFLTILLLTAASVALSRQRPAP